MKINFNIKDMWESPKKWKQFAYTILGIQALFSLISVIIIAKLGMLPPAYVVGYILIMALLLLLADILLIISGMQRHKNDKTLQIKKIVGLVVSAVAIIISVVMIFVLSKLINTIDGVTEEQHVVIETTAVYVMDQDPAKEIKDAADYVFGYTQAFDYENTQKAIESVSKEVSKDIALMEYDSVNSMVDALYQGQVGAIFLNKAYVDILKDMGNYENFSIETRIIYENEVRTVQEKEEEVQKDIKVTEDPFVVYISGSDTRTINLATSRSDVNILAVVNPTTKQILLINTPRDYYIPIAGKGGANDKLTHCGLYGIDCSEQSLTDLYGIDIDYYGLINFTGFETLIDAVGGVVVESDRSFSSSRLAASDGVSIYNFNKGENYLTGAMALAFARERHNLSDGDIGRGKHQMAMIKALVSKLSSSALLTNYSDIMKSVEGMFATDFTSDNISDLVKMQVSDMASWNIQTFGVFGTLTKRSDCYSMPGTKTSIIVPDMTDVSFASELAKKVMDGETLTDEDVEKPAAQ